MIKGTDIVDLHAHSTCSDGTDLPVELVAAAQRKGLGLLALTDHDTLDGLEPFLGCTEKEGLNGIGGVEVSSTHDGCRLHVVGLGLTPARALSVENLLQQMRDWRAERNLKMVDRLVDLGFPLAYDDVKAEAAGAVVGRPHFGRALVKKGYVKNLREAFDRLLADFAPAYVAKRKAQPREVTSALHEADALAIVAHPHTLDGDGAMERRLEELRQLGADGVEAYHPDLTPGQTERVLAFAAETGMLVSGGSDYHGKNKANVQLGRGARRRKILAEGVWPLVERLTTVP